MTIELLPILEAFSGGIIISSLFFITHIFSSINPYHKPLFPLASCISMIIFVALIVSSTSDESVITSVRIVIFLFGHIMSNQIEHGFLPLCLIVEELLLQAQNILRISTCIHGATLQLILFFH